MKKFIPLIIIITIMIGLWSSGITDYLTLDNFQTHKQDLRHYVDTHYATAITVFMLSYVISVALSLPFASLLTLIGGFLFGFITGTLAVVSAATLGAAIIFVAARSSFGQLLRDKAGQYYQNAANEMNNNAISYLFFLRLVPLFPFFVVNILPALFNVSLRVYILTTFFGILPGTAVYVYVGQSLVSVNNPTDLVSTEMISAITALGLFALVPTLLKKLKKDKS